MRLKDFKHEPFGFWLVREFLAAEDEPADVQPMSDRYTLLTGTVLCVIIILVGLIFRGPA